MTRSQRLLVGQPIKRVEDGKFLTGKANYIDDIRLAGMLHAVFVRSTQAHARIVKIDDCGRPHAARAWSLSSRAPTSRAASGRSWAAEARPRRPRGGAPTSPASSGRPSPSETVNYVGEAVAVVIAEDAYSAEDGGGAGLRGVRARSRRSSTRRPR